MARAFSGTAQYLSSASAVVTAVPLSIVARINVASLAAYRVVMFIDDGTNNNYFALAIRITDGYVLAESTTAGVPVNAVSTAGLSTGGWYSVAAVFASSTSRAVYLNGGSKGTNATLNTPVGLNRTDIGRNAASGSLMNGSIAEIAVYSVALSDADVLSYHAGISPLLLHPEELVSYWPLIGRASPEPDLMGLAPMTITGATVGDHPRIYYPSDQQVRYFTAAAPGGGRIWRLAGIGGGLVGTRGGLAGHV